MTVRAVLVRSYYLFAGASYYPTAPPGDFILRGTLDECQAAAKVISTPRPRRWAEDGDEGARFYYSRIDGSANAVELGPRDHPNRWSESETDWWRIMDADMRIVEYEGTAYGDPTALREAL